MQRHGPAVTVFVSYSHRDDALREQLLTHLSALRREGTIEAWHDRRLSPGDDWKGEIDRHIQIANVVLLLISAHFIQSNYCYDVEMSVALQRHATRDCVVIPVILRACDWTGLPCGTLQAVPRDARPITSWRNRDEAWSDVVVAIRDVVQRLQPERKLPQSVASGSAAEPVPDFSDDRLATLASKLALSYEKLEACQIDGGDVGTLPARILGLKRQLRAGGQLEAGDFLGDRYRLVRIVGQGGFAHVWRAYDRLRRRVVAVKVLHGEHSRDASRIERFFRGARAMGELRHSGIVRILDEAGRDGPWRFFVMEYLGDGDLRQAVTRNALSRDEIIRCLCEVAESLEHAHKSGVIHRDVSPANVLLRAGSAVLTDFDLAMMADTTGGTRTGAMGKVCYCAPEMLSRPQDADVRVDVFGLGMTAIFCLFGRDLPLEILRDSARFIRDLDCSAPIKRVLSLAVAWSRDERLPSALAFRDALVLAHSQLASPGRRDPGNATRRILVVDDQRNMRSTLAMMLRGAGYEVDEAADGEQGAQRGATGAYDAVLCDLRMGTKDGIDVLRATKDAHPLTEVIVMTAYGTIESAVEAMRLGAYDYIQKPFTERELLAKVASALSSGKGDRPSF